MADNPLIVNSALPIAQPHAAVHEAKPADAAALAVHDGPQAPVTRFNIDSLPRFTGLSDSMRQAINRYVWPVGGAVGLATVGALTWPATLGFSGLYLLGAGGMGLGAALEPWANGTDPFDLKAIDWRGGNLLALQQIGMNVTLPMAPAPGEKLSESFKKDVHYLATIAAGFFFGLLTPEPLGVVQTLKSWAAGPATVIGFARLTDGGLEWYSTADVVKGLRRMTALTRQVIEDDFFSGYIGGKYGMQMNRARRRAQDELTWAEQQRAIAAAGEYALKISKNVSHSVLKLRVTIVRLAVKVFKLATQVRTLVQRVDVIEAERDALRAEIEILNSEVRALREDVKALMSQGLRSDGEVVFDLEAQVGNDVEAIELKTRGR